jgi:predicted MFS family arabinose efflux permease
LHRILTFLASHGAGRALRHRNYALYAAFNFAANVGYWVQRVGVPWLAWQLTHSYSWLGAVSLAEALGLICTMPVSGTLADRVDRLRLVRYSQIAAMCVGTLLACLTMAGWVTIAILFIFSTLNGVIQGVANPTRTALIPSLLPAEDLAHALALNATIFNLSQFIGPAIAGLLIDSYGIGFAFLINALGYLIFLTALVFVKARSPGPSRDRERMVSAFCRGFGHIFAHRALGPLLLLFACSSLLLRPYRELFAGFADGHFDAGVRGLAMLASASGIGSMASAFLMANFVRLRGLSRLLIGSMLCNAMLLVVFGTASSFAVAVCVAGAMSFLATAAAIGGQILVQNAVPDELRGRTIGVWGVQQLAGPRLGAAAMGVLIGHLGFALTFSGAAVLFFGCWVYFVSRRAPLKLLEEPTHT